MRTLQQQRADVEVAQKEAREAQAWLRWISDSANHVVIPCEANRKAAIAYLNGEEMTVENLTDSFNSPNFRATLALRTTNERAESLKTIKEITGVGETPLTKWTPTEVLAKKAAELEERRELGKKTTDELRQIIKDGTPQPVEPDLGPEWNKKTILALSAKELRKLINVHGTTAVNRRLAGTAI